MDATTIVLPAAPAEPPRPGLPLLAATVPVIAGVVLWLITGSLYALGFAALGPLMLIASFLDGVRGRRRERRRAAAAADEAWQRAEAELRRLHAEEHAARWRREPDAAGCVIEPPLRGHEEPGRDTTLVIGRGTRRSSVRATGGDDDRSRAFLARAEELDDAPISVPLGGGVFIRAAEPVGAAVARALVTQLCLRFGAGQLALGGDGAERWGLAAFPHARRRRAAFVLRLGDGGAPGDAAVHVRPPGEEPPDGVTTVLDCEDPLHSRVRTPDGTREVSVEALSVQQVAAIAAECAARTAEESVVPDRIALSDLTPARPGGLAATVGRGERGDLVLDLVEDGPHALVTGITGTGKSELLTTWITAMAAGRPPSEVSFVLVDFKGGTAFEPLRALPHVLAVVTDLDAAGARRGVGGLTAELRRREAALAAAGSRDVAECPGLGRLVIVVDEFAALLQEHPDLGAVFTDIAARGRALGMHLVLGTQRAGGVIRDALAANCPLRLSLRLADPADSRSVIGSDAAAQLPGDALSRGLALVRRPADAEAHAVRMALASEGDVRAAASSWREHPVPESPWLPPLPTRLPLAAARTELRAGTGAVLGRVDEPERQRQPWVRLAAGDGLAVIGGPGSGKSTAVRMLAAQLADAVVVPADPEEAWDAVAELASGRHGPVLCDDLDVLLSTYPADHSQLFLARWETIVRAPAGAVITLSRASGPLGRLVDALPRRALLRLASRVEHIAAGGEAASFDRERPPGRAVLDGRESQLCWQQEHDEALRAAPAVTAAWSPRREVTGVVTPAVRDTVALLAAAHPGSRVCPLADDPDGGGILVADAEEWRARWAQLQRVRSTGELVVVAECAPELRQLAGVRDLPPYARTHAGRAWAVEPGRQPRRVLLA
ncbi:FtsK/SpoIIIE domain-containing protein [Microbacterium sp.]|uniref:FtsK/SpoIIIE domain-containing protein n=1 Tax=Microbacterium sp. TaxID=51671 RepID=UPI002810A62B|nr:FtsK/SpoIIIE domain-containing protein [Microbacterium sp.]